MSFFCFLYHLVVRLGLEVKCWAVLPGKHSQDDAHRIGINGYGRIGQCVLRALYENGYRDNLQIVAIHELADVATIAYLTLDDTTHGRFPLSVTHDDDQLIIGHAEAHLDSGAPRLLFSQPAHADVDATIVYGINEELLRAEHKVVSNASCTTNCIVPVLKLLQDHWGIEHGVITTIHSAMNDQPVIDA